MSHLLPIRILHRVGRVLLDVADPIPNVEERLFVRYVVYEQDAHRAAVVRRRDRAEALLPRRVPDLKLHALAVDLHRLDFEVDPDRRDERGRERVVAEPQQQATLAHT